MRGRTAFTSIGQLCRFEIILIKLCGGFLFDEHHNWYFTILYKLLISSMTFYFAFESIIVYDRIKVQSKSAQQNINFFWTFHQLAVTFAFINSTISSIRYKRLVSVVLNKRFDTRYFLNLAECPSKLNKSQEDRFRASRETGSKTNSAGGGPLKRLDERRGAIGRSFFLQSKRQICDNVASLNMDFSDTGVSFLDRYSKVLLARYLIAFYLISAAIMATLRLDYAHHQSNIPSTSLQPALALNGSSSFLVPNNEVLNDERLAKDYAVNSDATKIKPSINSFHLYVENSKWLVALLLRYLSKLALKSPMVLLKLVVMSLIYFQMYGQTLVILLITSTLADLLWRVRQQELARKPDAATNGRPLNNTESPVKKELGCCNIVLNTTDLLIQVRDVLLALRSAARLDYLFIQVLDMSIQMHIFSMFVAFIASNKYGWIGLLFIDSWLLFLGTLLTRLGYLWLHAEVRKMSSIFERRFIAQALETQQLSTIDGRPNSAESSDTKCTFVSSSSSTPSLSLPATGTSNSPAGSASCDKAALIVPATNGGRRNALTNHANQKTRIQANTNYRLASEIEQIWPTDWFKPDIESYVSQSIFVITFVTTLQQLVEASAKLQLQAQRNGGGLLTTANRTNL